MAARMQKFLQPQRKQPSLAKGADRNDAGRRSGTEDRGLGDLRPSASQRECRSHGRGAREGDEADSDEHRDGKSRDDAGAALARRLGVHSSSSEDSKRSVVVSEGEQWAAVIADDGISTPRGTGGGLGAGKPSPKVLHSPAKRDRLAAAEVTDAVQSSSQKPRAPAVEATTAEEVSLLESPEKRQKTPRALADAAAVPRLGAAAARSFHSVDDVAAGQRSRGAHQPASQSGLAAAQEAAPCGPPSAAHFSIQQRPAQPGALSGSRGQGRGRLAAAATGTMQIKRFLQRKPALSDMSAAEGEPCRMPQAGEREGAPLDAAQAVEEGMPLLQGSAANATSPGSIVDLTQSASPQHGVPTGALTPAASSARGTAITLQSSAERCSVERELEELLQSRGVRPQLSAAERTPQLRRGRALEFGTPSTGGDIVVDLATPPSLQPVLD